MTIKVEKRDGKLVDYDLNKIKSAIERAGEVFKFNLMLAAIDYEIRRKLSESGVDIISVDEIQTIVENHLMRTADPEVARKYITYRYLHDVTRNKYNDLMAMVEKRLLATDVQNQNANVDERSFGGRQGEMADAVARQYALDYIMSPMSRRNHENNEIYIHDLSAYAIGSHNCFDGSTKFVTSTGVRQLKTVKKNELVEVIDKDGKWRQAKVECFGRQDVYDLVFKSGNTQKIVTCTRNHRWLLNTGEFTDDIQIGDKLALLQETESKFVKNDYLWCFGFILGDGCDAYRKSKSDPDILYGHQAIRLCGDKVKYANIFEQCGYSIGARYDKDLWLCNSTSKGCFKQVFLDSKLWLLLSHDDLCNIFEGYIAADGFSYNTSNKSVALSTSDLRMCEFIEYCSSIAGHHILSKSVKHGSTPYKKDRVLYNYHLIKSQSYKRPWVLVDIKNRRERLVYCVVEPITHTFTLDGCMVTGNCLTLPIDDLLKNGFKTRQTDVRPAQSVNTAMQLVAVLMQLQSLVMFGPSYRFAKLKQC